MMKIKPKLHNERISDENRSKVFFFFAENPEASKTDAMRALNLSYVTVCKHVSAINEGWRPQQ